MARLRRALLLVGAVAIAGCGGAEGSPTTRQAWQDLLDSDCAYEIAYAHESVGLCEETQRDYRRWLAEQR